MKVCHVSNYLPNYHNIWSGAEQACFRTAKVLSKDKNIENIVLSLKADKKAKDNFQFFPIPIIDDYIPKFLKNKFYALKAYFLPIDPIAYKAFNKFFKENRPDVVHLHKFSILSFAAISAAKKNKIPIVHSFYDYWILCPLGFPWKLKDFNTYEGEACQSYRGKECLKCKEKIEKGNFITKAILKIILPFSKKLFDKNIKKIDKFIVLSQTNKKILLNYGIPNEKISIVPLALPPLEDAQIDNNKVNKKSIWFVGSLHPHKGPWVAIDALKHVVKEFPQTKLYMVVDRKADKFLNDRIVKNDLKENVEIIVAERKDDRGIKEYLKKAMILIIPDQGTQTISYVLTEGMFFARALVVGNIAGSLNYIKDGQNGFLIQYNDPKQYALKIIEFLKNPELAFDFGVQAQKYIQKMNSDERIYKLLNNLYKSLCQK